MKIRAITAGLPAPFSPKKVRELGNHLERLARHFESKGYQVQTRRIALPHWGAFIGALTRAERADLLLSTEEACRDTGVDFCSIGMAREPAHIEHLAEIVSTSTRLNGSAEIVTFGDTFDRERGDVVAKAVLHLSQKTESGFGNFRFGAGCCLSPGTPFFPGSFHEGNEPAFSIGFENADLLVQTVGDTPRSSFPAEDLVSRLTATYVSIADEAKAMSNVLKIQFRGLDTSIAPSVRPEDSIVKAFEALSTPFGSTGTLAICSAITTAVKQIPVPKVGYCGIMLPVLEDVGLARAVAQGQIGVTNLLAYSSVCGVGVDMVPIPGAVEKERLIALFSDVATMALRLNKPLSVRVLPVPGKNVGDATAFNSPLVCNAPVMSL